MIKYWVCYFLIVLSSTSYSASVEEVVNQEIQSLMSQQSIPGMSVGVILNGKSYVFNYGVQSKDTKQPVTSQTLFELGSISKTFSATLAAFAQEKKILKLTDTVDKHLPILEKTQTGQITLLQLATHVTGGFPLQVPEMVKDNDQLMKYFQEWKPQFSPDTHRTYANPSIGLLGLILAKSMKGEYPELIKRNILTSLMMLNTFFDVPKSHMNNYAQGYTRSDSPARMSPGVLANEAYGMKSSIIDMTYFLLANMNLSKIDHTLQNAILNTQIGYYKIGPITQSLIWEYYNYPLQIADLVKGNSSKVSMEPNPVIKISTPELPLNVWINKTGSTNGFGGYVAFIPKLKSGIILLANKNYPNDKRVITAHAILTRLLK